MSIESASPQRSNLAEFVDKIWFCEIGNSNNAGAGTEMLMPTGRAQLIFGLHESAPDAFVQGPTATAHICSARRERTSTKS